jgi:hypothetical protein
MSLDEMNAEAVYGKKPDLTREDVDVCRCAQRERVVVADGAGERWRANEKLDLPDYINGVSGVGVLWRVCADIWADQIVGNVLARDCEEWVGGTNDLDEYQ